MPDSSFLLPSDLKANYEAYRDDLRAAALRVLDSGWYIGGAEVEAFENAFAGFAERPHCVGCASGTDALILALKACEIGPGDVVVTVAHTAVATVAAIELTGALPALVDIDPRRFTMDPGRLEVACEALSRGGAGRLRAVIPVHLYGQPADMPAILEVASRYGLLVIEDCAQAHGARLAGRRVGTWGQVGTYSFYPTKNLGALGDGGALVTGDPVLAERARLLREYGWKERYVSHIRGMNSRLDPLQAALLGVKLVHLDEENAYRRTIAARYDEAFADSALLLPESFPDAENVYHQYVVMHPLREALRTALRRREIGTLIHYPVPVHRQPAYEDRVPLPAGPLSVTETVCERILSLPIHGQLTAEQRERVVTGVREWLAQAG
ncbi:MAG: DegT/DnrJ/EryC1/StrS family aminotransferase [Lentisphaeria bacterium]|nr:DegT/DnrJ/EryC1/StrS family aminotransferase [Lentisphaeria bacterium]